jgi:hypothetical protein
MMEEKFAKTASISEGQRKAKKLASTKMTFGFAAAFCFGGAIFVSGATYADHPASIVAGLLALFCMWAAYQVGNHINYINHEIERLKREGERTSQSLYFSVNESLLGIIRP